MTLNEYQELTEFLGRRFEAIDRKFEGIEARLSRVEVLGERSHHHVELLAEGLGGLRQEMSQRFDGVDREFTAVRGEMAAGFSAVRKVIRGL